MDIQRSAAAPTKHSKLLAWVSEVIETCRPRDVHWCSGSQPEYDTLCEEMVRAGTLVRLNPEKRPRSFLSRSDPRDVARVEHRTFICTNSKDDAGPTNNWVHPREMKTRLDGLFAG